MRMKTLAICVLTATLSLPLASSAQPDPQQDFRRPHERFLKQQGPHHGGGPGMMGGPRRKHLEQFRMLKLLEFLDLTDEQEIPFLTRYRELDQAHDSLRQVRMGYIEQLARQVEEGGVSEAKINQLIDKVRETERQKINIDQNFLNDARNILTPEQVARLVVFQDRFEFEMLRQVGEFQRRRLQEQMMNQPNETDELE